MIFLRGSFALCPGVFPTLVFCPVDSRENVISQRLQERKLLKMWHKLPLGLKDEPIRIWW